MSETPHRPASRRTTLKTASQLICLADQLLIDVRQDTVELVWKGRIWKLNIRPEPKRLLLPTHIHHRADNRVLFQSAHCTIPPRSFAMLPPLPLEVKAHVLRYCDPSTLAATSQACLALLELSGPLLYEEVEVKGPQRILSLLCTKSSADFPQLAPYLSLAPLSRITYHIERYGPLKQDDVPRIRAAFSDPTRLLALPPGRDTLPIESITIVHKQNYGELEMLPVQMLFHHLSPRRCHFACPTPPLRPRVDLALTERSDSLEEIIFDRTAPMQALVEAPFLDIAKGLDVKVTYDHRRIPRSGGDATWTKVVNDLTCARRILQANLTRGDVPAKRMERIREVEIVVSREEDKAELLKGIDGTKIKERTTIRVE